MGCKTIDYIFIMFRYIKIIFPLMWSSNQRRNSGHWIVFFRTCILL